MARGWKLFGGRSRMSYRRKRNWVTLTIWAVCLALVLAAVTILYDELVDISVREAPVETVFVAPTEATEQAETEATEETRAFAPDFEVYDAKGNLVSLARFRGKPTVLIFWASWNGKCVDQIPVLNAAYEDYKNTVNFLFVNIPDNRDTREVVEAFLEERGYTFPVYYDTDGTAAANYELQSMPSTYFIDSEGRAVARAEGVMSRAIFEKGLAKCYHD